MHALCVFTDLRTQRRSADTCLNNTHSVHTLGMSCPYPAPLQKISLSALQLQTQIALLLTMLMTSMHLK